MAIAPDLPWSSPPGQPDIGYAPDPITYQARVKRRQETEKLSTTLPDGFPKKLQSDLVWEGDSIGKEYNWTYELNVEEIEEIDQALRHFEALGKPLGYVDQTTFPLRGLHKALRHISDEIHNHRGFKILRGIPVTKYTLEENMIIYAGVSSHICPVRGRQDDMFNGEPADMVIGHIKDLSNIFSASRIGAPSYTTEKQVFHTDSGDVVALFALTEAAKGGQSNLSSSWRVYNQLAETRPDLIRTLAEPWPTENFKRNQNPYYLRPLLHFQPQTQQAPERLVIQYARRTFTGYWGIPRSSSIPPITEAQAEALDAIHFIAEKYAVRLDFRQGDIQYVNNMSIFHAREAFEDSPEKQRHLLRLWLRDPEQAWETPKALQRRWDGVYKGVAPEKSVFPLEAHIRSTSERKPEDST